MALVVVVLDDLYDLPVTLGGVGVLEGLWRALRLWAELLPYQAVIQPDRMLSIVHLYKFDSIFGDKPNFFSLLMLKRRCCAFFTTLSVWVDHFSLSVRCGYCPVDVDRGVLPLLFPEVHNHLLCFVDVEGEVIFLTPHSEGHHLLPVDCLVVGNQAKLDD